MSDVTEILGRIEIGDPAAAEQLLPLVYDELRSLAAQHMAFEKPGQTLQATALVHEAYLRLVRAGGQYDWDNRGHFFAAAATAMRRILIENARRKKSLKRGGDRARSEWEEDAIAVPATNHDTLLELDDALAKLAEEDSELANLVELRYFTGLTIEETASVLGKSPPTVKRNWAYARAWLRREIDKAQ